MGLNMKNPVTQNEEFGVLLKRFRKSRSMSQTELGEAVGDVCGRDYSSMTISNWENGKTIPSLDVAVAALDEVLETGGLFGEMLDVEPADAWRYAMEKRLAQLEATVSALLKAAN